MANHDLPPQYLAAIVNAGLRSGTPAGLASAVRAAVLDHAARSTPSAGDLAAVCLHPDPVPVDHVPARDGPDPDLD